LYISPEGLRNSSLSRPPFFEVLVERYRLLLFCLKGLDLSWKYRYLAFQLFSPIHRIFSLVALSLE
jgi:hypothetical protein